MRVKFSKESNCVSCPQGCIQCGRQNDVVDVHSIICDGCDKEVEEVWDTSEGYLCEDCLNEAYPKTSIEDIEEHKDSYLESESIEWIEE